MLVSRDIGTIKTGVKSVYREEILTRDMMDLLAEIFVEQMAAADREQRLDLIAWIGKTLGLSRDPRYRPLLQSMISAPERKLQKYGEAAMLLIDDTHSSEPFVASPGIIDRMRPLLQLKPSDVPNKEALFLNIEIGNTLDQIIDKIGMPDGIASESSVTLSIARHFHSTVTGMSLDYLPMGSIHFRYVISQNKGWSVSSISNTFLLTEGITDPKTLELADRILSDDWKNTAQLINEVTDKRVDFPTRLYDIAAERLYQTMNTRERYEIKMLTYLEVFLRASDNPRYLKIMNLVEKESDSRHIRRHARKAVSHFEKLEGKHGKAESYYEPGLLNIGKFAASAGAKP